MKHIPKDRLIGELDDFFSELLQEARRPISKDADQSAESGPKVGFVDKMKLFEAGTKWVMVRDRVNPEQEQDEFGAARDKFVSGARGRGPSGKATGAKH